MDDRTITAVASPALHRAEERASGFGLDNHGLVNVRRAFWNLRYEELGEEAVHRGEAARTADGALVVDTSSNPKITDADRYLVKETDSQNRVWWGQYNRPFAEDCFSLVLNRILAYLQQRELFVQDGLVGSDPDRSMPTRIVSEHAWHSAVARSMLYTPTSDAPASRFIPELTLLVCPGFQASPAVDGLQGKAFAILNLDLKLALLGGSNRPGEIVHVINRFLSDHLLRERVLPLSRCATVSTGNGTNLLLGPSGSGYDEIALRLEGNLISLQSQGWGAQGIYSSFNGHIRSLAGVAAQSGQIPEHLSRTGAVLQNVSYDESARRAVAEDSAVHSPLVTYPLSNLTGSASAVAKGEHPKHMFLFTCDARGVLPPLARLTPNQAAYYYLSGYSAEVEAMDIEPPTSPEVVFNACCDGSNLVQHPTRYAQALRDKLERHQINCWLVNTGWTGGPHGVGRRVSGEEVLHLVEAAGSDALSGVKGQAEPLFGFEAITKCQGVPDNVISQIEAWANAEAYKDGSARLATAFAENFRRFADRVDDGIAGGGPNLAGG